MVMLVAGKQREQLSVIYRIYTKHHISCPAFVEVANKRAII